MSVLGCKCQEEFIHALRKIFCYQALKEEKFEQEFFERMSPPTLISVHLKVLLDFKNFKNEKFECEKFYCNLWNF